MSSLTNNARTFCLRHRYPIAIIIFNLVLLTTALGTSHFWDDDEGFFASTAAEMFAKGDVIVPMFNGEVFGHKPPWMYWMMMAGYSLFGVNEFSARIFSAMVGVLTSFLTFLLGKHLFNDRVGFYAGLILPTCLMFNVVSRAATPDVHLVLFTTLALYLFAKSALPKGLSKPDGLSEDHSVKRVSWLQWIWIYVAMAMSVLVKGPIGILFPMAVVGAFKLCTTDRGKKPENPGVLNRTLHLLKPFGPVNFFKAVWWMRPLTGLVMLMLIAVPWYVLVGLKTEGKFLQEFFYVHHLHRFTSSMDNHSGPLFYYPVSLILGTFPWSFFALPIIVDNARAARTGSGHRLSLIFLACWIVVFVGIFSLAKTKLPNYVLPVYPAIAVLIGLFFERLRNAVQVQRSPLTVRLGAFTMLFVGMAITVGILISASIQVDGQPFFAKLKISQPLIREIKYFALLGLPFIIGGAIGIWCLRKRAVAPFMPRSLFRAVLLTSIGFYSLIWLFEVPRLGRLQTPQLIAKQITASQETHPDQKVVAFRFFRPSMVFYCNQSIVRCEEIEAIQRLLESSEIVYVVTDEQNLPLLDPLIGDLDLITEVDHFPKPGRLYLYKSKQLSNK